MSLQVGELIERDGGACVWCGRQLWHRDLTREHVVPRSRGGHMTLENAVVACRTCNKRRGSKPVDAYVRELVREGAVKVRRETSVVEVLRAGGYDVVLAGG